MNLINLPSAALPQSAGAAASTALPLDLAMLDSAVPEELFAALLAGQLQAVTALAEVTGERVEVATQASDSSVDSSVSELVAMLQAPQSAPELGLLAASAAMQPVVLPMTPAMLGQEGEGELALISPDSSDVPAGQSDAALNLGSNPTDARQALAAPAAAFAMPSAAAAPAETIARSIQDEPINMALRAPFAQPSLPQAGAETALPSQSQGTMTFALPQMQQPTALSAQTQTMPVVQTAIPQQVGSQAWGGMVGERVVWMFGQQHQSAEIMLNPPSLGPLEVRLSMSDGQANLTFTTQHAPVREALEAATPRLREMLSESGIGLGNVSVNVGNFSRQDPQNQQQATQGAPSSWSEAGTAQELTVMTTELSGRKNNGLLDLFA